MTSSSWSVNYEKIKIKNTQAPSHSRFLVEEMFHRFSRYNLVHFNLHSSFETFRRISEALPKSRRTNQHQRPRSHVIVC